MTTSTLAGRRLLVIEDNPQNMRLFRAVLQLDGAEVLSAADASAGLRLAETEQPDLILMDIQMPEMDGLAATRSLRANPITRHIPIVAVTASVMERDRHQTLDAGCDGYIPKPIDPAVFCAQVGAFLPPPVGAES